MSVKKFGSNHANNPTLKNRKGTTFKVVFPTMPSLVTEARRVELHQTQYQHDILILSFKTTGFKWFSDIPTGLPIKFSWNQAGLTKDWYGYVSFVSRTNASQQKFQEMEVHCVGASFPLKERANKVFNNSTIPEAARAIASQFNLNFVGDSHPRRFPQLVMAGHSYWEWLAEQAKRIGFVLRVDGTNMYFRQIDKFVDSKITAAPILYAGDAPTLYKNGYLERTLDKFVVQRGDFVESGVNQRTDKSVAGVDPMTGETISSNYSPKNVGDNLRTSQSDVLFSEFRSDQVVGSYSESELMSEAAAQLSRLTMPAKVHAQGDPRIEPYTPVHVMGTSDLTDGYWLVRDVVHIFRKYDDYIAMMTLVTDGTGANQVTAFRGRQSPTISTVNIGSLINDSAGVSTLNTRRNTELVQLTPSIIPAEQGFKRSPALWTTRGV
jgi:phage protein D